jgi:hypothetical protein
MSAQSGHPATLRNTRPSISDTPYLPLSSSPQAPELHFNACFEG